MYMGNLFKVNYHRLIAREYTLSAYLNFGSPTIISHIISLKLIE